MRQVAFFAAMMTFAAVLASASASAVETWGPRQNGGQCFVSHKGEGKDLQFGYWAACPQPVSTATKPAGNAATSTRRPVRRAAQ